MLRPLNSHEEEDPHHHCHRRRGHHQQSLVPRGLVSSSANARQLLISCAELIHRADYPAARHAVSLLLSAASSSDGDSRDRLVHQFARALALRLAHRPSSSSSSSCDSETLQSSYLSFNKVTPFLRFAHLTANQAILEAIDGGRSVHILDLDTSHGVQWAPLLQAIAERSDPSNTPSIRITGAGPDPDILRRTGDRLQIFADSLGLRFQFQPLHLPPSTNAGSIAGAFTSILISSSFQLLPGETLAVNCTLFLHKLLENDQSSSTDHNAMWNLMLFLRTVKAMDPAVVTVAEREADYSSPSFLHRFMEALDHYTAVFESLEATLPPNSRERLLVEQVWLGREIEDVINVAWEGGGRGERRRRRFEQLEELMRGGGFANRPLSPFALSQAKLLLRLHYPSEGYRLQMAEGSVFLGWQDKPLFSVSSWH